MLMQNKQSKVLKTVI